MPHLAALTSSSPDRAQDDIRRTARTPCRSANNDFAAQVEDALDVFYNEGRSKPAKVGSGTLPDKILRRSEMIAMFQSTVTDNFQSWDKFLDAYYEPIRIALEPYSVHRRSRCRRSRTKLFLEALRARHPEEPPGDHRQISQLALRLRSPPCRG